MTSIRDAKVKKEEIIPQENLLIKDFEEIILTEKETQDLENKLKNIKVDNKTRSFFKSAHQFAKKLKQNKYTISLEDIEKVWQRFFY